MRRLRFKEFMAVATAMCIACSFPLSASDDLFEQVEKPAKTYQSKQPKLLPPSSDLFEQVKSPTVDELKAHAEKRLLPGADKPLAVGMCCEGVIGNYDEAYRLSVKTGKPLRVLVGQSFESIVRHGKTDDGFLKCRVDDGQDARFQSRGVFEFEPKGAGLVARGGGETAKADCTQCSTPNCQCGCAAGGTCSCATKDAKPLFPIPEGTPPGTSLFIPKQPNDVRTFDASGKPTTTMWSGLHGQSLRYPLNEYGGIMWWAPIDRPDLHQTPPPAALSMAAAEKASVNYNPPVPLSAFFPQQPPQPVVQQPQWAAPVMPAASFQPFPMFQSGCPGGNCSRGR